LACLWPRLIAHALAIETAGLSAIRDKLELFDRFGTLEDEIEPLETALQDIVDAISAAREVASDIARGA
jgi:hypothetical protein